MNNTFIILVSPILVVKTKITFSLHVVYGQKAKMYSKEIGFSASQRRGKRLTQLGKLQYPMRSTTYTHFQQDLYF